MGTFNISDDIFRHNLRSGIHKVQKRLSTYSLILKSFSSRNIWLLLSSKFSVVFFKYLFVWWYPHGVTMFEGKSKIPVMSLRVSSYDVWNFIKLSNYQY